MMRRDMNTRMTFRRTWASGAWWSLALALLGGGRFDLAASEVPPREPRSVMMKGAAVFELGFDLLASFPYEIVDMGTGASDEEIAEAMKVDQVPTWMHGYDNQRVLLTGYMMAMKMENGRTTKFVMMKDVTTCCYGATPNMNDYLIVTMPAGAEVIPDIPVQLLGTFRIDQRYDSGYLVSLFVMDGEELLRIKK
jgi:hypothetical protein